MNEKSMKNYDPPENLLAGRVIMVTGAGQGIGRTAALTFAEYGATVILHGRTVSKLESVYDEIEAAGYPQPAIFPLDLKTAGTAEYKGFAEAIAGQLGRLDGILHNAAELVNLCPLEDETLERWLTLLRVNLAAPFALTRACMPLLKAAPDASVVMTLDNHGHYPTAYWGGFAVAKAGLEALVRIWAQEMEVYPGLRINGVIPGPVRSPQRARTHPGENPNRLPTADTLMAAYLYLMGAGSQGLRGRILDLSAGTDL